MSTTTTTTDFYKKRNDYNLIHQDEVEAGSILVALSNHKPKSSMSIYNLLGTKKKPNIHLLLFSYNSYYYIYTESEQHKTIRKYEPSHDKQHCR